MSQSAAPDGPRASSETDFTTPAFAVVGMSGRFPGAADPETLWANLRAGVEGITFFSDEELLADGESPERLADPAYVKACGRLANIAEFDAAFFGLSPRDAAVFDPQHRLFLECAWEAFENAGYVAEHFEGPVGVFASSGGAEYLMHNLLPNRQIMESVGAWLVRHTGNDQNFLATRASYELNLTGPSMSVQSACSSSLLAVHIACQSLMNGECDMALAGGATVYPEQNRGYFYEEGEILSPDGHCRAFDAASAGTVMASAVGCVVLRRLEDALRDGDQVMAIVRGSAVNNDGSHKVGYLAPSVTGQARVVSEALAVAGVEAQDVSYIEAHGTGTLIGDPIEITGLTQAFRASTDRKQFCAIGSLKTNIGHTGEASGICGFIKTVLALQHREIPPSLHYQTENPQIDFASSPFFVNARLREWTVADGKPRIAGVTALGAGGTNVHVIVQEAPMAEPAAPSRPQQLLVLSARTPAALDRATHNLATHLRAHPQVDLADLAFTLRAGRKHFANGRAVVVNDAADALRALEAPDQKRLVTQHRKHEQAPPVFFMFPGGGAQYARMGAELYERQPTYRQAFDEAVAHLEPPLRADLRRLAFARPEQSEAASASLESPSRALPALLATEYALARLLMSWGITPTAMIGHSAGEYAAAALAGVITLREAMSLVALRGRLFETIPPGAMLSVPLPADQAREFLGDELSFAAINAPSLCVLSGPVRAIAAAEEALHARDIDCTRVRINVAAHSSMVDPILAEFERFCHTIAFKQPQIPFISNVTGTWITDAEATDPAYWARHLRGTVRFADGVRKLTETSAGAFCEIGPGRTLSSLVRQQPGNVAAVTPTLRHPKEDDSDLAFLLGAVGRLWLAGVGLDEARFLGGERRCRVALPTYPFERQRYWVDPDPAVAAREPTEPLRKRSDIGDWFSAPSWARSAPPPIAAAAEPRKWLVFTDESKLANTTVARLRGAGHMVVEVVPSSRFAALGGLRYAVNPSTSADFEALAHALGDRDALPQRVLHLWALSPRPGRGSLPLRRRWDALESYSSGLSLHYFSLIFFAQAFAARIESLRLFSVSSHLQSVPGDAELHPEKAVLLGACKVIPREYPHIACISIDVARPSAPADDTQLVDRLLRELGGEDAEGEVALRGTDRWVRRFDPVRLEAVAQRPWLRDGGVYLVTGGLGGIGLRVAEHLASSGHVKLALLGRTPLPPEGELAEWLASHGSDDETSRRILAVQAIRGLGAEVMTVAADVTDLGAMRAALAGVRARFGALHGVFHAAGVLQDDLIALRAQTAVSAVLDAKMKGALVLDTLLASDPLELFVLFSSVSSILGLAGQADYTAANAFLDAFAHARAGRGAGRTLSIDWNAWQDVGMLASRAPSASALARKPEALPGSGPSPTAYPALEAVEADATDATLFRTSLRRGGNWLVDEHVVRGGDALIPGTGFLEIARAALELRTQPRAVELRDVFFLAPFAVPAEGERSLNVRIDRGGDGEFTCFAESETDPLVIGKAGYVDAAPATHANIDAIRERCNTRGAVDNGQLVQHFMNFGPRWGNVKRIDLGAREALLSLELPAAFVGDLDVYRLHPALLDLATGGAQALVPGFDGRTTFYVPFSYGRVLARRALTPRLFSHVRLHAGASEDAIVFDATLYDELGEEIASVESFTMRKAAPGFVVSAPVAMRGVHAAPRANARPETATQAALRLGMTAAEGVEALDRMLAVDFSPQVVACTVPLHPWLDRLAREAQDSLAQDTEPAAESGGPVFSRPNVGATYAPPRDAVERELAGLWSGLLGVAEVGVHDDFFELGGQSLVAVRFFQRIGKKYGVDLPLATLFEAPTVAECAALLRDRLGLPELEDAHPGSPAEGEAPSPRPSPRGRGTTAAGPDDAPVAAVSVLGHRSLVAIQRGDDRPALFCVHGAGGNVLNFRDLARAMDPRQPVYALQASGIDGVSRPHATIEDMAAAYLAEIRAFQPHGPYLLAGYSGGGLVAFDMAQRLTAAGERVELLALIDTYHPQAPLPHMSVLTRIARLRSEGLAYLRGILFRRRMNAQQLTDARIIAEHVARGQAIPLALREAYVMQSVGRAAAQYHPQPWPGRATLFRATDIDYFFQGGGATYGWDRDILGGVEVVMVPGDHDTLLLGTNATLLVSSLTAAIDRATCPPASLSRTQDSAQQPTRELVDAAAA